MNKLALAVAMTLISVSALARDECSSIEDSSDRLACYDALAQESTTKKSPWEGPLGVKKGISPEELSNFVVLRDDEYIPVENGTGMYRSKQAPQMGEIADDYAYWFEDNGLMAVKASYESEFARSEVRSLIETYGKPENSEKELKLGGGSVVSFSYNRENAILPDDLSSISVRIYDYEDNGIPDSASITYNLL